MAGVGIPAVAEAAVTRLEAAVADIRAAVVAGTPAVAAGTPAVAVVVIPAEGIVRNRLGRENDLL